MGCLGSNPGRLRCKASALSTEPCMARALCSIASVQGVEHPPASAASGSRGVGVIRVSRGHPGLTGSPGKPAPPPPSLVQSGARGRAWNAEPRNLPGPVRKPSRLPRLVASLRHAKRGPRPPHGGAAHLPACMPAGPAYLRACLSCLSCPRPEPPLAAARARPEGNRGRTHFRFRSVPLAAPCPARAARGLSGNMAAAAALARGWWRGLAGPVALSRGERGSANDRRPGIRAAFP